MSDQVADARTLDVRFSQLRALSELAYMRTMFAALRAQLVLRAGFNPDQPRDDHGRWTDTGAGAGGDALLAQVDPTRRYSVGLPEEEARGGHAIRTHVAKTNAELTTTLRAMRIETPMITIARRAQGSFESLDSANDFVNRVLESNSTTVDMVASGALREAWITNRFGYPTGREAFRTSADAEPYIRSTYHVGVFIRHDTRADRGYTVVTAYPHNEQPQ